MTPLAHILALPVRAYRLILSPWVGHGCRYQPTCSAYALEAIREALPAFDRQIKGFAMADAVLTGVETRTSSPLRVTRGRNFQSLNVVGLYPAGEGAGYAGGIMSAGVDGIEVAEALGASLLAERGTAA